MAERLVHLGHPRSHIGSRRQPCFAQTHRPSPRGNPLLGPLSIDLMRVCLAVAPKSPRSPRPANLAIRDPSCPRQARDPPCPRLRGPSPNSARRVGRCASLSREANFLYAQLFHGRFLSNYLLADRLLHMGVPAKRGRKEICRRGVYGALLPSQFRRRLLVPSGFVREGGLRQSIFYVSFVRQIRFRDGFRHP